MEAGDSEVDYDLDYLKALSDGLSMIWTEGVYADVVIDIDGKTFNCHKVVLAAMSPYFNAMFASGMRECVSGVVGIQDMKPEVFETIVSYVYTGKDVVTQENALQLLQASALLQIRSLQDKCEDALESEITTDSCLDVWKLARAHDCRKLNEKALDLIVKKYASFSASSEFLHLDANELISIVKHDDINVPSENFVCDSVLRWIKHDPGNRKSHIGPLLQQVRLANVSPEYLYSLSENYNYIKDNPICTSVIDEAKQFNLLPARQQEFDSPPTYVRSCADIDEVLVLIGGCESTDPPYKRNLEMIGFSIVQRKWFVLTTLPCDPGIEFASCTYGNDIYISGGGAMPTCTMKYDAGRNKWKKLSEMTRGRRRHSLSAFSNVLYVVGGFDSKMEEGNRAVGDIEKYSIEANEWEHVSDLCTPVSSFSSAVVGEKIYIFGGEMSNKKDTAIIQCFDTRCLTVSKVGKLPIASKLTRCIVTGRRVFVVYYDGKMIEILSDMTNRSVGDMGTFHRIHMGTAQYRGDIIILGGQDEEGDLCDDIFRFDVTSGTSVCFHETLPAPRLVDGCVKIRIKKKYLSMELPDDSDSC